MCVCVRACVCLGDIVMGYVQLLCTRANCAYENVPRAKRENYFRVSVKPPKAIEKKIKLKRQKFFKPRELWVGVGQCIDHTVYLYNTVQ